MQNINNYFYIYSLDYTHLNDFREALKNWQGELKNQFQDACEGTNLKESIQEMQTQLVFLRVAFPKPIPTVAAELISNVENCCLSNVHLLKEFQGSDPYAINMLVHTIMGTWEDDFLVYQKSIRQNYFDLMKKTGFLKSDFNTVNGKKSKPISPDLKQLTEDYLSSHPDVNLLTLGCGKAYNRGMGTCHVRRPEEHSNNILTIDLSPGAGPDIVANMHDDKLWKAIPDNRFNAIYDHTYGHFLFDDSQHSLKTISEIFRVLKPEGNLKMDGYFHKEHIVQLKQAGFVIESEISKIAKKPNLISNE